MTYEILKGREKVFRKKLLELTTRHYFAFKEEMKEYKTETFDQIKDFDPFDKNQFWPH